MIRAGVQSSDTLIIHAKGMPIIGAGGRRGDLHMIVVVETPKQLTKRQEELLRELAELDHKNVSPQRKSFFEKLRELFVGDDAETKDERKTDDVCCLRCSNYVERGRNPRTGRSSMSRAGPRQRPETTPQSRRADGRHDGGAGSDSASWPECAICISIWPPAPARSSIIIRSAASATVSRERKYSPSVRSRGVAAALRQSGPRAVQAYKQAGETGPFVQGVAMVMTQFLELLKRNGITRIDAEGKPFDPNLHQAVVQKPTSEVPPNTVVQVIEAGFLNQDRVLRPAKVIVSSAS